MVYFKRFNLVIIEMKNILGVPSLGSSAVMNPTSIHKEVGFIPGPTQWVKDRVL